MKVRDEMTRNVITIGPNEGVAAAKRVLDEKCIRHLPVLSEGALVGIITDRDISRNLPSPATSLEPFEVSSLLDKLEVRTVMTRKVITVTPDTSIETAARLFLAHKIGGLPVLDGERLVGIITRGDVLRVLLERVGEESEETAMCWLADAMRGG